VACVWGLESTALFVWAFNKRLDGNLLPAGIKFEVAIFSNILDPKSSGRSQRSDETSEIYYLDNT
jgi:hypothetical protein